MLVAFHMILLKIPFIRAFEIYGTIIAVKALSRYSYSRFASSCILIRDSWASTHVNLTSIHISSQNDYCLSTGVFCSNITFSPATYGLSLFETWYFWAFIDICILHYCCNCALLGLYSRLEECSGVIVGPNQILVRSTGGPWCQT